MDTFALHLFLHAAGSTGMVLWFLFRVRPKFPSALATGIVVVFAIMVVLFIDLIIEFAMAPLTGGVNTSLGYMFEISVTEETLKILIVFLGIFIAREDSTWTDTRLTLALIAGIVFGIVEGLGYVFNYNYTPVETLILFATRMHHAVLTVALMAGILLITKGRKLAGTVIAVSPYLIHAFFDYFVSIRNYTGTSLMLIASFVMFFAGIRLLLPVIEEEKRARERFEREATIGIEEHWLKKMERP